MIPADNAVAHELFSRTFSTIVAEMAEERAGRLAATLDALRDELVRLVCVANPLRAKLSLKRILIQVRTAKINGASDEAQIIQALSARHFDEEHVLLIIEQAETLEPDAVSSLRALTNMLREEVPAPHVLFVGTPAMLELGIGAAPLLALGSVQPLRTAGVAEPATSSLNGELMPLRLGWRRTFAVAAIAAGPLGFALALSYPGASVHEQAISAAASLGEPPAPSALPTSTPVPANQTLAAQAPPAPASTSPAVEPVGNRMVRLRADFDQFLASSSKATARLTTAQRDALFQEYLVWRRRQTDGLTY